MHNLILYASLNLRITMDHLLLNNLSIHQGPIIGLTVKDDYLNFIIPRIELIWKFHLYEKKYLSFKVYLFDWYVSVNLHRHEIFLSSDLNNLIPIHFMMCCDFEL